MAYVALTCRALVGLVFAVSAFSKLRNATAYRRFASSLARLPVPLVGHRALPPVLAGAEAAIVVLVAVPATATAGLALAAVTLAALTAGTAVAVRRGARVSCRCFGPSQAPLAARHILRNGFLLGTALAGAAGAGAAGAGTVGAHPAEIVLSLMAAMAAGTFVVFLDDLAALTGHGPVGPATAGGESWPGRS